MRIEQAAPGPEPMWYAASAGLVEREGGPFARRLLRAAPWPEAVVDIMRVRLDAGQAAVSPGARGLHDRRWRATGPDDTVLVASLAERPVLTLDGVPLAANGTPKAIRASTRARGLVWDGASPGEVLIGLARRALPGEALERRRRSGRIFRPRPAPELEALPDWAAARPLRFESGYRRRGPLKGFEQAPFEAIAAEPIFGACHPMWVAEHGGPIARAFAAALPPAWRTPDADVIVNAKINEFEPGWYSCLAGWHIDGTSRINKRADGTPDLLDPGPSIEQIACNVGSTGLTGFLLGRIDLPVTPMGGDGRGVWSHILDAAVEDGTLTAVRAPAGECVGFGFGDFHTCRVSRKPGWRYFIKAMRGRGDVPTNALRETTGISWPMDAGHWPDCPLGIFPATLPTET